MKLFVLSVLLLSTQALARKCLQKSCYPATGDLLIGRESDLFATSTCGLKVPTQYCILAYLSDRNTSVSKIVPRKKKSCFYCNSQNAYQPVTNPNSHRIENVVAKIPQDRKRWWQSVNGLQNVNITLNLEAEFHFTHLIMTFKTFRPAAMYIERSFDFGQTWRPYRYYSSNCKKDFPSVSEGPMLKMGDVICSKEYTDMSPSSGGEVIFRAVPTHLSDIDDPYKEAVQELVKLTNLRIVFTRLHTLGDLEFDKRPEVVNNYYYALYELNVRGSCSCYGHAEKCLPMSPGESAIENMVYGKCECSHNTEGMNCHICKPFYNDLPWRPADINSPNECKECNCNGHSDRCHFDAAVYKASGGVSGGVCDECRDNTQGKNCQECDVFYYHDVTLPLSHPEQCKFCNCDPNGSVRDGECEQKTDPVAKTVAGRCICKRNTNGTNCGRCKHGYWNLTRKNPVGCDRCKCFLPGTLNNEGCDKSTGSCTCKRYVVGPLCDKCMKGTFGLSQSLENGCRPCDCSPVGSRSARCDIRTGNCRCKEGMEGRRCDRVSPGYFVPKINVQVFEVEEDKVSGTGKLVIYPANVTGGTHTGRGGWELGAGDFVEMKITSRRPSGMYNIVIRVQPKEFGNRGWPQMRVTVFRLKPPAKGSKCYGHPEVESFLVDVNVRYPNTPRPTGAVFLPKQLCINENETLTIRIETDPSTQPNPNARIIVDSVLLIPDSVDNSIRPAPGTGDKDWERNWKLCRALIFSLNQRDLPEICKKIKAIITVILSGGNPKMCRCDKTGALSLECQKYGGHCMCKPGVTERKCDRCLDNYYGFGPKGCKPCNCDSRGSRFLQCNPTSGQCECINDAYGRRCNQCKPGFWDYPNCRPCQCNFHSTTCDSLTGKCHNCSDFTDGDRCERCRAGYYGDPTAGGKASCKPCMCPGGMDSGLDHSIGCVLDSNTNRAKCLCKEGYVGARCDKCKDNYYGDPLNVNSKCQPCDCSGNIDRSVPNSCDPVDGSCKKCLNNTAGSNCQECRNGYFGNATRGQCRACVCHPDGIKTDGPYCDKRSGQCACLPNVKGRRCHQCVDNYWNMTKGVGCQGCNCDREGSKNASCNILTGQCHCVPGRGGLTCRECQPTFWGDPRVGCKRCQCHKDGSRSLQCERRTGKCRCKPGVTGEKCDKCDRGTRGVFPNCEPCGECWIRWYQIITELLNKTLEFKQNAGKLSGSVNLPQDYRNDLDTIEKQLKTIENLLKSNNVTSADVKKQQDKLKFVRSVFKSLKDEELKKAKAQVANSSKEMDAARASQRNLEDELKKLKNLVDKLKKEASDIKDSNFAGAFQTVQDNKKKYDATKKKLQDLDAKSDTVKDGLTKAQTDLNAEKKRLAPKLDNLNDQANKLAEEIRKLKQETLPGLNKQVCGGPWSVPYTKNPVCLPACGGGGCGNCGGAAVCEDGSKDKMNTAKEHLARTKRLMDEKQKKLMQLQKEIAALNKKAEDAKKKAKEASDEAAKVADLSNLQNSGVKNLLEKMKEFLNKNRTRQDDLKALLNAIKAMKPAITDEEVQRLKTAIEEKSKKVKDANKIVQETEKERKLAEELTKKADAAKKLAQDLKKRADEIAKAMKDAEMAQKKATADVGELNKTIHQMNDMLNIVKSISDNIDENNKKVDEALKKAKDRKNSLTNDKVALETSVEKIEKENAENTKNITDIQKKIDDELKEKIKKAENTMNEKERMDTLMRKRATALKDKVKTLQAKLDEKIANLTQSERKRQAAQRLLDTVEKDVDDLTTQLTKIYKDTREYVKLHELC